MCEGPLRVFDDQIVGDDDLADMALSLGFDVEDLVSDLTLF